MVNEDWDTSFVDPVSPICQRSIVCEVNLFHSDNVV